MAYARNGRFKADDKGNVFLSDPDVPHETDPAHEGRRFARSDANDRSSFLRAHRRLSSDAGAGRSSSPRSGRNSNADGSPETPGLGLLVSEARHTHVQRLLATRSRGDQRPADRHGFRGCCSSLLPLFALLLALFYWRQRKQFYLRRSSGLLAQHPHVRLRALLLVAAGLAQVWSA